MPKDSATFDIQQPTVRSGKMHASTKFVIVLSIVLVVVAGVYIGLMVKQKRARDAYLRTPEGQLNALKQTSQPVTATIQERAQAMEALEKSSRPVSQTREGALSELQSLE